MSGQKKSKKNVHSYTTTDLLLGRNLEIIAAALLLTGKLRINYISIYRDEPRIDALLTGKFMQSDSKKSNIDQLRDLLENNGDMTVNDLFNSIHQRLNEEG
jgi:hypothetical protein